MNNIGMTIITGLVAVLPIAEVSAGDLEVTAEGFANSSGQARFVLVRGEDGYRGKSEPVVIGTAPVEGSTAQWRVEGLEPGSYALIVHHDADGDNELDRPLFGLPTEIYGYSNGAWTSVGIPDWQDVFFEVGSETATQSVRLRLNAFVTAAQAAIVGLPALIAVFAILALVRRFRPVNGQTTAAVQYEGEEK